MKHFFIVHSNITWLVTKQIIEQEKLAPSDCLVLIDRKMQIETHNICTVDISNLYVHDIKLEEIGKLFTHYWNNRKALSQIDAIIEKYCPPDQSFELYLPHQKRYKYFAFFTHLQCQRFHYVEEGNLSYGGNQFDDHHFQLKYLILKVLYRFFLQGRIDPFPNSFNYTHTKYGASYCLSELAFPGFPNKKLLPLPFKVEEALKSIQHVWVLGPYVEVGQISQEVRLQVSYDFLNYLIHKGIKNLHIKFHPTQYLYPDFLVELKSLFNSYNNQIQITEIPQSVSLENIAISSKADFYLITSSVAIYAIACGCRVFSFAKQVIKYCPSFEQNLHVLPENIRKKIEFIEL